MTELDRLIAKLEPQLRDAFRAAMQDLRDGVDYRALVAALEAGDIERAITALDIEPAVFNQYLNQRVLAYSEFGQLASSLIPTAHAAAAQFRFDMTNPRAEGAIREHAASSIVGYTQEQVDIARQVILEGYSKGNGPAAIATDIAGRVNPVTKRREGGIIGLSTPQVGYVSSVKDALDSDLRRLFVVDRETGEWKPRYTRMDGRDIRTIKSAITKGRELTDAEKVRIVGRYNDRLLARRAEDVARTETAQGVMTSRMESYRQALQKEGLPLEAVEKEWLHSGLTGDHARVQHIIMNGVSVVGLDTPFIMPDGTAMQVSHDPAGGAKHSVNCRCQVTFTIDFSWGIE